MKSPRNSVSSWIAHGRSAIHGRGIYARQPIPEGTTTVSTSRNGGAIHAVAALHAAPASSSPAVIAGACGKFPEPGARVTRQAEEGKAQHEILKLPLAPLAPGDVEKARLLATRIGSKPEPKFLEKVWAFKVLDVYGRDGKPLEVEVQVIALGRDVAWVSLPGEIFVELGLAIKESSPFKHTIIAELANGSIGYIPTKRAYAGGNYEPNSARCGAGSGEMLVDAALRMLKELHGQTVARE